MTEAIPKEILDAAHRRLCRQVAAQFVQAMGHSDVSFELIEKRLGWTAGAAQSVIIELITGKTKLLREVSDLACAMGAVIVFQCVPIEEA